MCQRANNKKVFAKRFLGRKMFDCQGKKVELKKKKSILPDTKCAKTRQEILLAGSSVYVS